MPWRPCRPTYPAGWRWRRGCASAPTRPRPRRRSTPERRPPRAARPSATTSPGRRLACGTAAEPRDQRVDAERPDVLVVRDARVDRAHHREGVGRELLEMGLEQLAPRHHAAL